VPAPTTLVGEQSRLVHRRSDTHYLLHLSSAFAARRRLNELRLNRLSLRHSGWPIFWHSWRPSDRTPYSSVRCTGTHSGGAQDHPRNTAITSTSRSPTTTIQINVYPGGRGGPDGSGTAFQVHMCARAILVGHIEMENAWTLGGFNTLRICRPRRSHLAPRVR
jgi:hypothetical protein